MSTAVTEDHRRPDPESLLARLREDVEREKRGRLKIFLGYAAGVGKTFAMLEAAHQRKQEGMDVVVGLAETHGRAETVSLLSELEVIPRRAFAYRGIVLQEMDVDALLRRRPQLVLVDELAHTNAPGSRHHKRYQDVEELLAYGIDVYTTLNIQHIESLNDAVAQITGIKVRETIPDGVIDRASELELVDLPPEELIQRLREGKVYVPDQAARAVHRFFRLGNLTALREIAMRRAAARVDDQMRAYMETREIPGPWPAKDHLLVCIGPSPLSEKLVRTARRLADELKAEWTAVYVETSDTARLSRSDQEDVSRMLRLVDELGGGAVTLSGRSIPEAVLGYARKHNVTKIIVGKPIRPGWLEFLRGSPVDRIIRQGGPIDVYIISGPSQPGLLTKAAIWRDHAPWTRYVVSLLLVAAGTVLSAIVHPLFSPANLVMIYLLVVLVAAIYLGRGPSLLAATLSVLTFDFFFVPPALTMAISDSEYLVTFAALMVVSLVVSSLAVRVRSQAQLAAHRESQTARMYRLSRDLASAGNQQSIHAVLVRHVSETLDCEAVVLTPGYLPDLMAPRAQTAGAKLQPNEQAVAVWVFRHLQPAGRGTDTLSASEFRYFPLTTPRGALGVLGVKPMDAKRSFTPEELYLLEAFASQTALATERAKLAEQARHAEVLEATERLQAALLNSISHDLRTPLVAISGALSTLQEDDLVLDEPARRQLVENASEETERLNRLVGNLLDMTRIEAGALRMIKEPCEAQEIVGSALEQLGRRIEAREIVVDVPSELPLVEMDFALMVQVLVNLLDNALKYSPAGSPVVVHAHATSEDVVIQVADRGVGIPPEDLARVFDKFFRVQRPGSVSGTGLGLSICKGIVEAHGGSISAENRPGGGTIVSMRMPLGPSRGGPPEVKE